jgi:hypothetical protein
VSAAAKKSSRRLRVVKPTERAADAAGDRDWAEHIDHLLGDLHGAFFELAEQVDPGTANLGLMAIARQCFAELHEATAHMRRGSLAIEADVDQGGSS